jgi:hypothetical protein
MNIQTEKILSLAFTIILVGITWSNISVMGDETNSTIHYTLEVGSFSVQQIDGYDTITCEDFGRLLVEGKPNLPSKIISIAVPPKANIVDVNYELSDSYELDGFYFIDPCPSPNLIGDEQDPLDHQQIFDENYKETYSSNDAYPAAIIEYQRQSHYRKYDLVDVRVNPFTYHPLSGVLEFHPFITVSITYTNAGQESKILSDNLPQSEIIAKNIISNYHEAQAWYESNEKNDESSYDYVIITLDSLVSAVDPLVDWETSKGRNVNVVTTSWIDSNYEGYDLQEKMRNFLIEKYPSEEWGILDLLLVGHYDDVPMRLCAQDMGYGEPETDYYYAELSLPDSQSWDADGDHQYGESTDPIDFYAEINVGRIPTSEYDMVESICNKSILFEQTNDASYKKNILLLAAFFWSDTDNAELMEEIASLPWMNNWTMTRMYEQSQSSYPSDYDLEYNTVKSQWSSNTYAFVDWAGHGSATACFEYYPSQAFVDTTTCDSLNDDYPSIIFADACSNQDTSQYNIGQAMLEQGAVGFLGATKVAYGMSEWNSPYDGSSQSFDYFFTSFVTSCNYSTGQAHQYALMEMYTNGLWYYDYYETFEWGAYLGNPDIWMSISPMLDYSPTGYDFGFMQTNETDDTTFEIWNSGSGYLHYDVTENCSWLEVSPSSGATSGEHDTITVTVDTTGLSAGGYHYDILVSTEEAGKGLFGVDVYVPSGNEVLDIEQNIFDRGLPVRHAVDGDWAAAQSFLPTLNTLTKTEIYLRKFGNPEFNLTVELRTGDPQGTLIDTLTFTPTEVPSDWGWMSFDFTDTQITSGTDYFIVCPPAPSGVTTSFGYEWGYAFGDQYPGGAFWFTRDGGSLWRDLPTMYDFTFKTYGYD